MTRTLLLGVDGGSSKTVAAVADAEGRVLGTGRAGCGSVEAAAGTRGAMREIGAAVTAALAEAGAGPENLVASCFGLAGADSARDRAHIGRALRAAAIPGAETGGRTAVVNDGLVALRGGLRRDWGVVSSSGTGTVAVARDRQGRVVQAGGTGYLSGDWGGGALLGRMAVRAVMMAEQGALPPTLLRGAVVAHLGRDDLRALLPRASATWARGLSRLAPAVFDAAARGDDAACDILLEVGRELGRMAVGAATMAGLADTDVEVALAGSTYRGATPILADRVRLEIHRRLPRADVHDAILPPLAGALLMAAEGAALTPGGAFRRHLAETLPAPSAALWRTHGEPAAG